MNEQDLLNRLRDVFRETLDDPAFETDLAMKMGDTEAWDSFAHIDLMLGIETAFGIEFDSEEIDRLRSIETIFDALKQRLDNRVA